MCRACETTFEGLAMANDGHKVMLFVLDPGTKDYTMASNLEPIEQLKMLNQHIGLIMSKAFPEEKRPETPPFEGCGI